MQVFFVVKVIYGRRAIKASPRSVNRSFEREERKEKKVLSGVLYSVMGTTPQAAAG